MIIVFQIPVIRTMSPLLLAIVDGLDGSRFNITKKENGI